MLSLKQYYTLHTHKEGRGRLFRYKNPCGNLWEIRIWMKFWKDHWWLKRQWSGRQSAQSTLLFKRFFAWVTGSMRTTLSDALEVLNLPAFHIYKARTQSQLWEQGCCKDEIKPPSGTRPTRSWAQTHVYT